MKRKAEAAADVVSNGPAKKQAIGGAGLYGKFGAGLFETETIERYRTEYAQSEPYKHAVVSNLINHSLLRSVRKEILDSIHFTPKETDIYKIHQSGDLANLDGLPASALAKLPSLLELRDALYSSDFRQWISQVSGAGALSGRKTDMAVNVYVPGCHLLCHDDVIGSRRVSYILYLTDPDKPWRTEWGGALRLYPTDEEKGQDGKVFKIPRPAWSKTLPPAWNQLSFFAVQPGESFHDVEEVYHCSQGESEDDGGRFRMAISGWYHIPQEGEEGYEPGLEERLAEKSSLQQLQGKAEELDEPQTRWINPSTDESVARQSSGDAQEELSEEDLEFLLQFMTPNYLTPDTVEELNELFAEESMLQLTNFLNPRFATELRAHIEQHRQHAITRPFDLRVSRPPHKHRYQYLHPDGSGTAYPDSIDMPYDRLLNRMLPSLAFRKWLSLATGLTLKRCSILARRFRRGLDYQLAQSYDGEDPQIEFTLTITPTGGWGGGRGGGSEDENAEQNGNVKGGGGGKVPAQPHEDAEEDNVGGYELYMAGDEAEDDEEDASNDGVPIPANPQSHTGAGNRRSTMSKADPAIYKASSEDDEDGILLSNPASWNSMSIVLRDEGTLKFVKYVSRSAKGDRWDLSGCYEVDDTGEEDVGAQEGADDG